MTTQTQNNDNKNRPTHIARKKVGHGKSTDFETIGVAWDRGDGSIYIKPYGTQIIDGGFYVFPTTDQEGGQ
tara:strand:+ start:9082 stop:9294 length:213 start_codon:yes stop_codon:yes gene_type:complete